MVDRHRTDVEGLRAVAVLLVVAYHAGVPGVGGGFVGVDVFFVLSGYLITGRLLDEFASTGRIDVTAFYARRARRLVPALAAMLLGTGLAAGLLYAPFEQRAFAGTWSAAALSVSNLDFARRTVDYHTAGAGPSPLLHTWSLGVEEQVYLVWPILLVAAAAVGGRRERSERTTMWSVVVVVGAGSLALGLALSAARPMWAFYLAPTRLWEFAAGGAAAFAPRSGMWRMPRGSPSLAVLALAVSAVVSPATSEAALAAALVPVAATIVLLLRGAAPADAVGSVEGHRRALLAHPAMQALGRLSYGWYLWHWPALVLAALLAPPTPWVRAGAVAVSLGLAAASYRWVETPLRYAPRLVRAPRRSIVLAVTALAGVAAAGDVWHRASSHASVSGAQGRWTRAATRLPRVHTDGCEGPGGVRVDACTYGAPDAPPVATAVLLGDSHAAHWFPALDRAARAQGWRLVAMTRSACPWVEMPGTYATTRIAEACPAWRTSADRALARLRPDVVFVASASGYAVDPATWEAATGAALDRLVPHAGRVVLLPDVPSAGLRVAECGARATWRPGTILDPDCRLRVPTGLGPLRTEAQLRAARARAGVAVLDLRDAVCRIRPCAPLAEGLPRYRDSDHLSVDFAATLAPRFVPWLPRRAPQAARLPTGPHRSTGLP